MSVKIERISEDAEDVVKNDVDDVLNNISSKSVKQLSKSERSRLISDFENGTENPYFKVMITIRTHQIKGISCLQAFGGKHQIILFQLRNADTLLMSQRMVVTDNDRQMIVK